MASPTDFRRGLVPYLLIYANGLIVGWWKIIPYDKYPILNALLFRGTFPPAWAYMIVQVPPCNPHWLLLASDFIFHAFTLILSFALCPLFSSNRKISFGVVGHTFLALSFGNYLFLGQPIMLELGGAYLGTVVPQIYYFSNYFIFPIYIFFFELHRYKKGFGASHPHQIDWGSDLEHTEATDEETTELSVVIDEGLNLPPKIIMPPQRVMSNVATARPYNMKEVLKNVAIKCFTTPLYIATWIGIFFWLVAIGDHNIRDNIPDWIQLYFLNYILYAPPLGMLILGLFTCFQLQSFIVAIKRGKHTKSRRPILPLTARCFLISIIRCWFCPALMWGICHMLRIPANYTRINVLLTCTPPGTTAFSVNAEYKYKSVAAASMVWLSIPMMCITLPLYNMWVPGEKMGDPTELACMLANSVSL